MLAKRLLSLVSLVTFIVAGGLVAPVMASDWRAEYPVVRLGHSGSENLADQIQTWAPLPKYIERTLGVKSTIRNSTDYAAIIEALAGGHIEVAYYGAAGYASAYEVMEGNIEPCCLEESLEGYLGYFGRIIVKADSPYQTLEDLEGKVFAFTDPNSTSGYLVPTYYLTKNMGKKPEEFFAKTVFAGSRDTAILSVLQGTADAMADYKYDEQNSGYTKLMRKGMVPPGGAREIWESPLIPGAGWFFRKDLPEKMKEEITEALLKLPEADPATWKQISYGEIKRYVPTTHDVYVDIIKMRKQLLRERRE